jgi:hypothetical protein
MKDYQKLLDRIPEEEIIRRAAQINGRKSGGFREGAGRPVTYTKCPRCGERVTKTQAIRGHGCRQGAAR